MPTKFDAFLAGQVEEHMTAEWERADSDGSDPADDEPASDCEIAGCCP